jgi:hypothetical protein
MGQQANSGRNASLDNKKARAAGRQDQEVRKQIQDAYTETGAKGRTGGAFGHKGQANEQGGVSSSGAGGGGGHPAPAKDVDINIPPASA